MTDKFDVAIIGGGVVGCAIARALSRFQLDVVVLERDVDVARGTSGKNSGVAHTGINVPTGSLKAKLNVHGAAMFESLCRELDVPYKQVGKLIVALDESQVPDLESMQARGLANGVPVLDIIDADEIKRLEPNITGYAAVHAPTAAITCPYSLTIALAESAAENGVEVMLESPVTAISGEPGDFTLTTPKGAINAALIINSAGLASGEVARMAGVERWRIFPCRGEYVILDKSVGDMITRMVYPVPPKGGAGLGIHITPTVDGNILLGPSTDYIEDPEDVDTTVDVRKQLLKEASEFLPTINPRDVITAYSGVRPKLTSASEGGFGDFVIEEVPERPGIMHLVGIESPGLTAAPAIAEMVAGWVTDKLSPAVRPDFKEGAHTAKRFREQSREVQTSLVDNDPDYGRVICRCELVTRREILSAIENRLGARSINSIKYRSRSMMGRCQGGFCGPRIVDLLIEEGVPFDELNLKGDGSWMFFDTSKGLREGHDSRTGEAVIER
ncbi:MAG: NAD(P)/FAD-dependent oxidoreductase [Chloroflexi bacterium]|nr:NAD(P)/FAD-dependent oxidoreductase [Chloroflexota bacterium]